MIGLLALRNFLLRPWRSALLLLGYSLGVAVMIVLLSVGEALLTQARNEKLVGGGDVTVLPEGIDVEVMKTGATGKAAARAFAARGDPLVLFGRDQARLDALRNELNVSDDCILARAVDLTDAQALQSAAQEVEKKFGGASVRVCEHCAGNVEEIPVPNE